MTNVRKMIAALVGVLIISTACMGVELTQKIKTAEGFTIQLPADWKPIPRAILDQVSSALEQVSPGAKVPRCEKCESVKERSEVSPAFTFLSHLLTFTPSHGLARSLSHLPPRCMRQIA